jgi:hypothetical protein
MDWGFIVGCMSLFRDYFDFNLKQTTAFMEKYKQAIMTILMMGGVFTGATQQ